MWHSLKIAGFALVAACAGSLAPASVSPAAAGVWRSWDGYSAQRYSRRAYRAPRYYNDNLRYYNSPRACSYGDCACLRGMALRTGNPTWWDKYQACSG